MNAIIVHGAYGNPHENWFPWLANELTNLGVDTVVPAFPTPEGQSLKNWMRVLEDYEEYFSADSILIGHSIGPALLLRKLESLHHSVKACFFVSGFLGVLDVTSVDAINASFFESSFNWEVIRRNAGRVFVYHSDNDPYVPMDKAREFAGFLGADVSVVLGAGHFNAAAGYTKFSRLLEDIKSISY
ncbi:MAG: serine hydrolase family protein [Candidatus Diapherotrites archaeon]|nr:serine hydrolase family protein [Candidatus Diapherotrites archaeon]